MEQPFLLDPIGWVISHVSPHLIILHHIIWDFWSFLVNLIPSNSVTSLLPYLATYWMPSLYIKLHTLHTLPKVLKSSTQWLYGHHRNKMDAWDDKAWGFLSPPRIVSNCSPMIQPKVLLEGNTCYLPCSIWYSIRV